MARTSKTKIGGGEGEQGERMMRAAASGAEAVQQAQSQLLAQHRAGAQQTEEMARGISSSVGQSLDRTQQGEQFDRQMAHRESELELEGAKAGFEKGGEDQGQEPQGDRAAKLEAEMRKGADQPKIGPLSQESQQRLNAQISQPLEMDAGGKWRPTKERREKMEREARREDFSADTERMRAMAYRDQVGVSAQKALAAGDKDAYEENVKRLVATPNDMQKRYDRLVKGDVHDTDWGELSTLARVNEDDVNGELYADLKAKQFTPRVAAFVRAQVQKDALTSIVLSKGSTNELEVDWTAPKMREFQAQVASINDFMRTNPALGQLAFINSTEDKMRFLNVLAASQVLLGMTQAPSPAEGMMPATMGQGAAPAVTGEGEPFARHSTPPPDQAAGLRAVRGARAGGATPSESLQAGQAEHPTAGRQAQPGQPLDRYTELKRRGL